MKTVPRQPAVVRRLGARIDRAVDAGDVASGRQLMRQMIELAIDPPVTADSLEGLRHAVRRADAVSLAAFRWLAAWDGGFLDAQIRAYLWQRPEALVEMIQRLRAYAQDPRTTPADRREAQAALAHYGFDDASLHAEDEDVSTTS